MEKETVNNSIEEGTKSNATELFPTSFTFTLDTSAVENVKDLKHLQQFSKRKGCYCCSSTRYLPINWLETLGLPLSVIHRCILPYIIEVECDYKLVIAELNFIFNRNGQFVLTRKTRVSNPLRVVPYEFLHPKLNNEFFPIVGGRKSTISDVFHRIWYLSFYPEPSVSLMVLPSMLQKALLKQPFFPTPQSESGERITQSEMTQHTEKEERIIVRRETKELIKEVTTLTQHPDMPDMSLRTYTIPKRSRSKTSCTMKI